MTLMTLSDMSDSQLPHPRVRANESPIRAAMRAQMQVIWALMLQDIKSRYFGNGLGYVITILWPAAHIAVILTMYVLGKRPTPYGDSSLLYASTGVLPFIAWNYMSRFTMMGVSMNKSFLAYPIIKLLDMIFARLALEHISIFLVTVALVAANLLFQTDIMPIDLSGAVFGLLSAVLLGIGFAVFNSVIVMIFPLWVVGYVLIIIVFWITAGLAFNPETMPAELGYYVSWNPLMHSIEWIRKAYYADFPAHLLNKTYVLSVGAGSLALGLVMERLLKRYFK